MLEVLWGVVKNQIIALVVFEDKGRRTHVSWETGLYCFCLPFFAAFLILL